MFCAFIVIFYLILYSVGQCEICLNLRDLAPLSIGRTFFFKLDVGSSNIENFSTNQAMPCRSGSEHSDWQ